MGSQQGVSDPVLLYVHTWSKVDKIISCATLGSVLAVSAARGWRMLLGDELMPFITSTEDKRPIVIDSFSGNNSIHFAKHYYFH